MIELGERLGFAGEACRKRGVAARGGRQDLQRHEAVEPLLSRLVDCPHAALAQELENFQFQEQFGHFRDRRRHKSGLRCGVSFRGHLSGEAGADEAFRAETHRHVRGERSLAAWANAIRFHMVLSPRS